MRQDPDIISVGEIRDGETAQIAMRAAITGHLVLSTIHTNDAFATIDRLIDIGVEPYLIATGLKGVISQRLVRRICPNCRKEYAPPPEELRALGLPEGTRTRFYRGEGCPLCFGSGYRGRTAVFEILVVNAALRRLISSGAARDAQEAAAGVEDFTPMTGWRVGYVMADAPIRERMQVVHQYDVVSVGAFLQPACAEALRYDNAAEMAIFRRRRDYVYGRLTGMGLSVQRPEGAFYMITTQLPTVARAVPERISCPSNRETLGRLTTEEKTLGSEPQRSSAAFCRK